MYMASAFARCNYLDYLAGIIGVDSGGLMGLGIYTLLDSFCVGNAFYPLVTFLYVFLLGLSAM